MSDLPRVVIVGGGFGGLSAARKLGASGRAEITLIDRRNHHLFQPLLYQVATAGLSPADIAAPIRSILSRQPHSRVLMAEVVSVNPSARTVHTSTGEITYDYLVLACGAQHSYFGHDDWEEFAPGLKTLEQATEIRRRVLISFENAEKETDPARRRVLQTFVIVGGGATGVELAGAIAEIGLYTIGTDFRTLNPADTRVILIEAGARIMATFDERLSQRALKDLTQLGIQVRTGTRVTHIDAQGVRVGQELIGAATVIWAAGVQPSRLGTTLGVPLDPAGRVMIQPDLSIPGHPEIFVIGDQSCLKDKQGLPLPGVAPVAMQQGRHVARQIIAALNGRARTPFRYNDKGQMATIGRKKAILQTGKLRMTGFAAWLAWLFIHIYYLIGFKNRIFVFLSWAWSYVTFGRGARIISDRDWRSRAPL